MNRVLDACAMIAYLRGENGGDVVRQMLQNPADHCFAHAVNLCEVYYDFIRAGDEASARSAMSDLARVGIQTRRDMHRQFWKGIGRLKATHRPISLADCFAVELSLRFGGDVVTSDRREFTPLAAKGVCRVHFIR